MVIKTVYPMAKTLKIWLSAAKITFAVGIFAVALCGCKTEAVGAASVAPWQDKSQFESPKRGLSDMKFIWE